MNSDIMRTILLNSDLKTIENYCTTNKYNRKLCNNHFWKSKYEYDQYLNLKDYVEHDVYDALIGDYDWSYLYSHMTQSIDLIDKIFKLLENGSFALLSVKMKFSYEPMPSLIPIKNDYYNKLVLTFNMTATVDQNNNERINCLLTINQYDVYYKTLNISEIETKNMLILLHFMYSETEIDFKLS